MRLYSASLSTSATSRRGRRGTCIGWKSSQTAARGPRAFKRPQRWLRVPVFAGERLCSGAAQPEPSTRAHECAPRRGINRGRTTRTFWAPLKVPPTTLVHRVDLAAVIQPLTAPEALRASSHGTQPSIKFAVNPRLSSAVHACPLALSHVHSCQDTPCGHDACIEPCPRHAKIALPPAGRR